MWTPVVLLVLIAALLHASWNAILRSEGDRLASMTVLCAAEIAIALPIVACLPVVSFESVPYIVASTIVHVGYCYFLVRAYDAGPLAQVYPIARGSSPVLVTIFAWISAGEQLGMVELLGVLMVSAGIVGLVAKRVRADRTSLVPALSTGGFIATYTVLDGLGARCSESPIAYVGWLCIGEGLSMIALHRILRGTLRVDFGSTSVWKPIGGAGLAMASYGIVVWAMSMGPMGPVSALRETSVLFAALIARVALREPLGFAQAASCAAISLGAACLAL